MATPGAPFLALPLELREKIYGEVLSPEVVEQSRSAVRDAFHVTDRVPLDTFGKRLRYDLALLRVNKQIYNEAKSHFDREEIFVRITAPQVEPLQAVPSLFWGPKAKDFTQHHLQVTLELDGDPSDNPHHWINARDYRGSPVDDVYRHHVIRAQDLPIFVSRWMGVVGDHEHLVAWAETNGDPIAIHLHLRDPRAFEADSDNPQDTTRLAPAMQRRLLLPFAWLNDGHGTWKADEGKDHGYEQPTSDTWHSFVDRSKIEIRVTSEVPLLPRLVDELHARRGMRVDPKPRLQRAEQLIVEGDTWLKIGRATMAVETYLSAFEAMDVFTAEEKSRQGEYWVTRTTDYNVMLSDPIHRDDDPGRSVQNVLPNGNVVPVEMYWGWFQHWRVIGIMPDDEGRWNHAAWERERLIMVTLSRLVRAFQRSGDHESVDMWSSPLMTRIQRCLMERLGGLSIEELRPHQEALVDAPGATAVGEIYLRSAVHLRCHLGEIPPGHEMTLVVADGLARVAFAYLEKDTEAMIELVREFWDTGRGWFPIFRGIEELEGFQGSPSWMVGPTNYTMETMPVLPGFPSLADFKIGK